MEATTSLAVLTILSALTGACSTSPRSGAEDGGAPQGEVDARASTGQPPDAATGQPPGATDARNAQDVAAPVERTDGAPTDASAAGGCPPSSTALVCNTLAPLPRTIKETGLFPAAPNFAVVPSSMRRFRPRWELWSDGLDKDRFVILPRTPDGRGHQKVDTSNREAWVFPVGTVFVKTFFADDRPGGVRRPVETRLIRRTDDPDPYEQYKFDVYRWNEAGTDAELLDLTDPTPVDAVVGGKPLRHQIPSRMECTKCHSENDTTVIGFDEVRLNWSASAGAATQLASFASEGIFTAAPPSNPQAVTDPNPLLARIKGFVLGNCVHCHSGRNTQLVDLRPSVFVQNTVGKMTMASGTATGLRVDPGRPENSILWLQLAHMKPRPAINPMPPVGVQIPNAEAVKDVADWIRALPRP
jgi:hypothetical protein